MELFFQIIGGALVAAVLVLAIRRQGQDITLLLGICVCCMILAAAVAYWKPVMEFAHQLQDLAGVDNAYVKFIFKAVGIALISEIAAMICNDSGNSAMGKGIQILASGAILWISLPLLSALLELIQKIMGDA